MKKLLILLFTLVVGFALTAPAFAQDAAAQPGQEAPKKDEMKKEEMGGKKAKKSHEAHAKKKGAEEGKKKGQEGTSPGEAPKQ